MHAMPDLQYTHTHRTSTAREEELHVASTQNVCSAYETQLSGGHSNTATDSIRPSSGTAHYTKRSVHHDLPSWISSCTASFAFVTLSVTLEAICAGVSRIHSHHSSQLEPHRWVAAAAQHRHRVRACLYVAQDHRECPQGLL